MLWRDLEIYAFGIDLFNFGYWWESHEYFEALWRAFGPRTPEGRFFQGLIQLAAAHLKRRTGNETAAITLSTKSRLTLQGTPIRYMGLDIATVIQDIERFYAMPTGPAVCLRLDFSKEHPATKFPNHRGIIRRTAAGHAPSGNLDARNRIRTDSMEIQGDD